MNVSSSDINLFLRWDSLRITQEEGECKPMAQAIPVPKFRGLPNPLAEIQGWPKEGLNSFGNSSDAPPPSLERKEITRDASSSFSFDPDGPQRFASMETGYDNLIAIGNKDQSFAMHFGSFDRGEVNAIITKIPLASQDQAQFFPSKAGAYPPVYYFPERGYFAELNKISTSKNKTIYRVLNLETGEIEALGIAKKTNANQGDLEHEKHFHRELRQSDPERRFFVLGSTFDIEIEGIPYVLFLMPLMQGGDLSHYVARDRPAALTEDEIVMENLEIFSNMLGPIEILHLQGIRHGDLKLENFLIDQDPLKPLLSDFGTTTLANPEVMAIKNDPKIRPPEQVKCKGLGMAHKGDLWSLGVIAAEMFGASFKKIEALALAVLDENEPLIQERIESIVQKVASKSLLCSKIVEACLRTDPEERADIPVLRERIQSRFSSTFLG